MTTWPAVCSEYMLWSDTSVLTRSLLSLSLSPPPPPPPPPLSLSLVLSVRKLLRPPRPTVIWRPPLSWSKLAELLLCSCGCETAAVNTRSHSATRKSAEEFNTVFIGSMSPVKVVMQGGGPWGFRLVGGKDFEQPLAVSRVSRLCPVFAVGKTHTWAAAVLTSAHFSLTSVVIISR